MSWADLLAAVVSLGSRIVSAITGAPVPPPADTKPPTGMTTNEDAARAKAKADAEQAARDAA